MRGLGIFYICSKGSKCCGWLWPLVTFLRQAGRSAIALDVTYGGEEFDLLSDVGFLNALFHTANLEVGGSALTAPVCSTFVFMILTLADRPFRMFFSAINKSTSGLNCFALP